MAIQIGVHPTGEEPDQLTIRVTPGVSRTITICEVPTNSKLVPYSWDEVLAPSDTRPGHHPGLPHSRSNKPLQSRGVRFDKVVTGLLSLPPPIKTQHAVSTNQSLPSGPKQHSP
jgi:hypothetical protein